MKKIEKWGEILILLGQVGIALSTLSFVVLDIHSTSVIDYIFIALVCTLIVLKAVKVKKIKLLLTLFLCIGTFNLFKTSAFSSYSEASLFWENGTRVEITFNPLYFCMLLFYLGIHAKSIMKYLEKPTQEVEAPRTPVSEKYIVQYEKELLEKDNAFLDHIISTSEKWQKEYVEAAQKIRNERNAENI